MFLDKATIFCKAGNGGRGSAHFHRDKKNPKGGPDGGDGGKGGDIVFRVTNNATSLENFRFSKHFEAGNGLDGSENRSTGKDGKDIIILVPRGTVIRNAKTKLVVADMCGEDVVLLKGGKGGRGNVHFATPTRQAPRFSEDGVKTKQFELVLELKTIADVGLIGFPNVGKSTLLAAVSNATPKIANYHFTTLSPNIGVVTGMGETFVMADIPGLIEGASEGAGLGLNFLRHIERTRLLVHVIDISGSEERDPYSDYVAINKELSKYSDRVKNLPQIIALNKVDLLQDPKAIDEFKKKVKGVDVYPISAGAYIGIKELVQAITKKLKTLPIPEPIAIEEFDIDKRNKKEYKLVKVCDGLYELTGELIDRISSGVVLDDLQSFAYFQKRMKDEGLIDRLKEEGMQDGDTVRMGGIEFEYSE